MHSEGRGLPVKQQTFLITAMLLCLSMLASATDAKQNAQGRSQQPTQTRISGSTADPSTDQVSPAKSDCTRKQKHAKQKHEHSDSDRDYQIPQNQVEYGGGG